MKTPSKVRCLHCQTLLPPTSLFNGSFCEGCLELKHDEVLAGYHSYHLGGARRCEIPGCKNHTDEGCFVGQFCSPCYNYIVGKSVGSEWNWSQAYHNELVKANFRTLAGMSSVYGKFGV